MNKESFRRAMTRPLPTYTETWINGAEFHCDAFMSEGHLIYRISVHATRSGQGWKRLYRAEEVDLDTAIQRAEELECLMSLSDALFSWIGA